MIQTTVGNLVDLLRLCHLTDPHGPEAINCIRVFPGTVAVVASRRSMARVQHDLPLDCALQVDSALKGLLKALEKLVRKFPNQQVLIEQRTGLLVVAWETGPTLGMVLNVVDHARFPHMVPFLTTMAQPAERVRFMVHPEAVAELGQALGTSGGLIFELGESNHHALRVYTAPDAAEACALLMPMNLIPRMDVPLPVPPLLTEQQQ